MAADAPSGPAGGSGASGCRIKIANTDVKNEAIHGLIVDLMIDSADMATITLNNTPEYKFSSQTNLGDAVEVKIGTVQSGKVIFKGEVAGIEPTFEAQGESKVVLRCFSMMHRLTRGKFSKTYEKQTFKQIATTIVQKYSLTAKFEGTLPAGQFEHIYQHVQSDHDFLLQWAARVGAEVLPNDKELIFRPVNPRDAKGQIKVGWGDGGATMEKFAPRLTTAGMVQKVIVRAWNPDKHEELEGTAEVGGIASKLGKDDGAGVSKEKVQNNKDVFHYDVDIACFSKEECEQIAKAKLEELLLNHITGDLVLAGNPDLKAGMVIEVDCKDDRFSGFYRLRGVQHRYTSKSGGEGGFKTHCRVQRNASGKES
jgi:phage protein D